MLACLACASGCELQTANAAVGSAAPEPSEAAEQLSAQPSPAVTETGAPAPPEQTSAAQAPVPEPESSEAPVSAPGAEETPAASHEPESTPEVSAEPGDGDAPESAGGPENDYTGPDLIESEPVDDGFFADAAFFGNSLVDGLSRYGGIDSADFYAATSASVVNVDVTLNSLLENGDRATLLQAMTEKEYGKIYILLGINEIGFEPEYFAELYGTMLERICQAEPDAEIYIMSLSPVTQACSDYSDVFNMERIGLYNEKLYALAQEKECYYVDLCAALAGEDGYLTESDSTDGIHLKPEKYPDWAEYLRTHVK